MSSHDESGPLSSACEWGPLSDPSACHSLPAACKPSLTTHCHPPPTITQHLPHTSHLDAAPATHHVPHTTSFLHWLAMLRLRSVQGCRSVSYPRMSASGAAGRQPILIYHELLGASPFCQSEFPMSVIESLTSESEATQISKSDTMPLARASIWVLEVQKTMRAL